MPHPVLVCAEGIHPDDTPGPGIPQQQERTELTLARGLIRSEVSSLHVHALPGLAVILTRCQERGLAQVQWSVGEPLCRFDDMLALTRGAAPVRLRRGR